jgi:hypothetical protein
MRRLPLFLLFLAAISPILGQRLLNFRGAGHRMIVISPLTGNGAWADPARPAILDGPLANGLGDVETANPDGLDTRWIPSDDGRWAIVELRAARRDRLTRALENRAPGARLLDPAKLRAADLETELKLLKRDFRWEQLSGAPISPVTPPKKPSDFAAQPAASSGERAAYSHYFTDNFTAISSTNWQLNGSLSGGATGLKPSAAAGGALISKLNSGVNHYEISTTLKLNAAGATYSHFVRATSNARAGSGTTTGSYILADLAVTSYTPGGVCQATLALQSVSNGTVTTILNPMNVFCRDGMEQRT